MTGNVRTLGHPFWINLLEEEGLAGYLKRLRHYFEGGLIDTEQHGMHVERALNYSRHLPEIRPTAHAQRAWVEQTRTRLEALRARRNKSVPAQRRAL